MNWQKRLQQNGEIIFVPVTKSFIVEQLYSKLTHEWINILNKDGKTSYTFSWIKNVNLIPEHFPTNFLSSQALTSHGRFPFYFLRFGFTSESTCRCKKQIQDFDHYLTECTLLRAERTELVKKVVEQLDKRKPEIIKKEETRNILEEMVLKINEFVLQT